MAQFNLTSAKTGLAALSFLLVGSLGCSDHADSESAGSSKLNLSLDLTGESDVSAVRFDFTPVDCTTGEATGDVISDQRLLENMTIPGGVSNLGDAPLDTDSKHVFADSFSTLAPGCYDVSATPLQEDGTPSAVCAAANKPKVEVTSGKTTEIFLLNQCAGHDKGGLDTIAALNHEPELKVKFESSKFVCSHGPQTICASASDPDGDPVEFVWSVDAGELMASAPKVLSHEADKETGVVTECVQIKPNGAGKYDVHVAAYDQVWKDDALVRIEDWLTDEGYPSESHAALDFFFYAADCSASLTSVDPDGTLSYSTVMDVSDDGKSVAGYASSSSTQAFRQGESGGLEALGFPASGSYSVGQGVSGDGDAVVGYGNVGSTTQALLWHAGSGWSALPSLPGASYSYAFDISGDGEWIVGYGDDGAGGYAPLRWDHHGVVSALPLPSGWLYGVAYGTNGDGSVVVGYSYTGSGSRAFRWDSATGATAALPSTADAYAYGVSSDGKVVVGQYFTGSSYRPALWSGGTLRDLGDVPGGSDSGYAWGASGDGSVVVGYADNGTSSPAMVWDAAHGARSLSDVLAGAGVDMSDWYLQNAYGISDDGKVVGGQGYQLSTGRSQGFIAHLP